MRRRIESWTVVERVVAVGVCTVVSPSWLREVRGVGV
jgi:hypothetical protein